MDSQDNKKKIKNKIFFECFRVHPPDGPAVAAEPDMSVSSPSSSSRPQEKHMAAIAGEVKVI